MGFELRHPVGMTTNTFQPGTDHDISRSGQKRVESAVGKVLRDFTLYKYRFAASGGWQYTRGFSDLTPALADALEAFFDAVGNDPFEFTDGSCGPKTGWVEVKLLPESYERPYEYAAGGHLAVAFSMVTVP